MNAHSEQTSPLTALVVLSHSQMLADGVVELAREMAPTVRLQAVGGTVDGRLGTDVDELTRVVENLLAQGHEVLICPDLGSAVMSAELVAEMLDDPRVGVVDLPLVRGTMAAACSAQRGENMRTCAHAGVQATQYGSWSIPATSPITDDRDPSLLQGGTRSSPYGTPADMLDLVEGRDADLAQAPSPLPDSRVHTCPDGDQLQVTSNDNWAQEPVEQVVDVADPGGIHARVAAAITRAVHHYDACVHVNGVSARNVFDLMALGVSYGDGVTIASYGPQAVEALRAVSEILRAASERNS